MSWDLSRYDVPMGMEVFKEFRFEAAHCLQHLPAGHKCRTVHGHSYRVRVFVGGEPGSDSGWIMDFAEINDVMRPVISRLDHSMLNEIVGLEMPTTERLARWIWERVCDKLPGLSRVEIWETASSGVTYSGSS